MSTLSTEVTKVYAVVLYYPNGSKADYGEFIFEDEAEERAKEVIEVSVRSTGEYYYCTIEKRIVPIYK
jgi:hypothetical protein